jgi:hypothetical protein
MFVSIVYTMCVMHCCAQLFPGTYSSNFQQAFNTMHNQAALPYIIMPTTAISTERKFMLKALAMHTATMILPTSSGTFACAIQQSGFSAYREQKLGIAYGRNLGTKISIGAQFDYLSKMIRGYGKADAVTAELGCLLHVTPRLHAGLHAFNAALRKLGDEVLPVVFTAGLGYEFSDVFLLSAETILQDDASPLSRFMCEYRIIPQLTIQLGLSTDPQFTGAAVSWVVNNLWFCLTATHHPQLGFSPAAYIIWQLKRKVA